MNTNFDDFDTKIQAEELPFNGLSEADVDDLAEAHEQEFRQSAYDAGWDGEGEGAMPCGLTVEEQDVWLESFHEGEQDVREHAACERAEYQRDLEFFGS